MKDTKVEVYKNSYFCETSPNQKSIYAINQLDASSTSYNITQALIVNQHLIKEQLHKISKMVINRYEALKASFHMQNGVLYQKIHEDVDFKFDYNVIKAESEINYLLEKFVKGFDLSKPGLLRYIAHEVAKELQGRGVIIKDIVFIDSYQLNKFWFADPSDLKIEVDKFFDEYVPMDEGVDLEEFQNEMFNQRDRCFHAHGVIDFLPRNLKIISGILEEL